MRIKDTAFLSLRLNVRTDAGWAVVGQTSGAVALDAQGKLLMKLTRTKAEQIAKTMTEASLLTSS